MGHGLRMPGLPLHERNEGAGSGPGAEEAGTGTGTGAGLGLGLGAAEDSEHERRRHSERFARAAAPPPRGRRCAPGRNRRSRRPGPAPAPRCTPAPAPAAAAAEDADGGSSSKENEEQEPLQQQQQQQQQQQAGSDEEPASSRSSSSHSFLQLHPQERKERSPSPEPSSVGAGATGLAGAGGAPPLDVSTLHQQVDSAEPLTSRAGWSPEGDEHEQLIASSRVMLSPRNSLMLARRPYLDLVAAAAAAGASREGAAMRAAQQRLKQLSKQASSLKKKLRRCEEEFERECGYRPSHAEKMVHKDMKRLCSELNKLRKEIKQLKEDPHDAAMDLCADEEAGDGVVSNGTAPMGAPPPSMEEVLQEVEQMLSEKRRQTGRPEVLEELSRDQLLEEKLAVQKGLLHLEDLYGRPVTKGDRDLVRPLYDRYRSLKRLVARAASSKMKDSISELATIHEHEAMDFTSSSTSLPGGSTQSEEEPTDVVAAAAAAAAAAAVVACAPPPEMCLSESSEALWNNLHSLSLSELLSQQRSTREEKKRLRRSLREFEEDFQRRTGRKLQREDRLPMEGVYASYKQAKARLRLLEALVSKANP